MRHGQNLIVLGRLIDVKKDLATFLVTCGCEFFQNDSNINVKLKRVDHNFGF